MKASVLLTSEGTYPCAGGGVSVWCDYLLRYLPEVDFDVFALVQDPAQRMQFVPPENVRSCRLHPLWGTEEPGLATLRVSQRQKRKLRVSESVLVSQFRAPLTDMLRSIFQPGSDPEELGWAMFQLHRLFQSHDYAACMQSQMTWDCFLAAATGSDLEMTLADVTCCLRWMQRYLSLLAAPFERVGVVHSSMAGLAGIPGVLCKLAHGSKYVLTEHGVFLRELYLSLSKSGYSIGARRFLIRFYSSIVRMNYFYADVVTTLGEFNRQWQVRCGADPAKIRVVPNGIDPAKFYPRPAPARDAITVLTMARIFPLKGIDILIRAAALVRDRMPAVQFKVLGDVADKGYFEECLKLVDELGLQGNIRFAETKDPASAYCEADVFCLPSRSEGLPFAVIEAMMCGIPVVASDVGNVADLLSGCGLTFTPNEPQELAQALLRLIGGEEGERLRMSLAQAGRERALRHYTIEQLAGQFDAIYEEMERAQVDTSLSQAAC